MDKSKSSAPARSPRTSREERGLALARERAGEIWRVGPWTWRVPSCSEEETVFIVALKPEHCPCEDFRRRQETCKHLYAAWTVKAKTARCSGCGERFYRRDLVELHEGTHDDLTWFHGDRLCASCADRSGVLR